MRLRDVRLRDARRIAARARAGHGVSAHVYKAWRDWAYRIVGHITWPEIEREIDRLISRYGPDVIFNDTPATARKKADRTDHRIGDDIVSDGVHISNAATHGGDGNSGECAATAETSAPERSGNNTDNAAQSGNNNTDNAAQSGNNNADNDAQSGNNNTDNAAQSGNSSGRASESASQNDVKNVSNGGIFDVTPDRQGEDSGAANTDSTSGGQQTARSSAASAAIDARYGEGGPGADEVTEGMGSRTADDAAMADEGAAGNSALAQGHGGDHHAESRDAVGMGEPEKEAADLRDNNVVSGRDARTPRPTYSEVVMRVAISRINRALQRLTHIVGDASAIASPKIDARALVRELVSRRVALHRAHQAMHVPTGIIVMPDLSGSCAWVADITLPLAERVAQTRNLLLAPTGAGAKEGVIRAEGIIGQSRLAITIRRLIADHGGAIADVHGWRKMMATGVTHILVLGDVHGHASYEAARDAGIRVIWLDPNPEMHVRDTRGMIYETIREATPAGLADAIERALRRTS